MDSDRPLPIALNAMRMAVADVSLHGTDSNRGNINIEHLGKDHLDD